ncbi:MAG: S8 family serine peptidase [Armatimonadetes bacterium]|nr:S8 family serine peptidase [Armatimonadota bacterium]
MQIRRTDFSPRLNPPAAASSPAAPSSRDEYVPGEVLVKTRPGIFKSESRLEQDYGARVLERLPAPGPFKSAGSEILRLELPEATTTAEALEKMAGDPRVEVAAPNHVYHLAGAPVPNDLVPELWGLQNTGQDGGKPGADIDAPGAWAVTTGKRDGGPVVAVLDTGMDYEHPDLRANLWTNPNETEDGTDNDGNGVVDDVHGYNAVLDNGDARAGHGHGTHVAGTIGAEGNNGLGMVGVNWQARIMPVKIFPDDGDATTAATIIRAIQYADRMGARITSNSWTGAGYNPIVKEVLANSPALHIFAAGNEARDNDDTPTYPASFNLPNQVVVAASDRNDELGFFSCYGKKTVDVAAPGVSILSTVPGGGYEAWNGTSMATPHVAGVAALIASEYPEATNQQIKDRLIYSADPLPAFADRVSSGGRLNAARAVARDELPPGAPNDFRARAGFDTVRASWTSTGDDGWCGSPSGYELRASSEPLTPETFASGELVSSGRAAETGKLDRPSFNVMPSSVPRVLHVGLEIIDKAGNRSELRTAEVTVPPGRIAFEDDMAQGERWTADAPWSRVETADRGPAWQITGSENGQPASLTSEPFSLADHGDSTLYLEARYNLESHYEFVTVEAAETGSHRWRRLADLNGDSRGWQVLTLPMHEFDQKTVQLRLRYSGDGPGSSEGLVLKKAAVTGYSIGTQNP